MTFCRGDMKGRRKEKKKGFFVYALGVQTDANMQ